MVVIGSGTHETQPRGAKVAKQPIATYINGMANQVRALYWVSRERTGLPPMYSTEIIPSVRVISYQRSPQGLLMLLVKVAWLTLRRPYAICYLPASVAVLPIFPIIRLFWRRTAIYLGNDLSVPSTVPSSIARMKRTVFSFLQRVMIRAADVVIVRGSLLQRQVQKLNPKCQVTRPLGFTWPPCSKRMAPAYGYSTPLVYVGKVLVDKGVGVLIDAANVLCRKHGWPKVVVEIVGKGGDEERLRAHAQNCSAGLHVIWHGWVNKPSVMRSIYSRAGVCVVPSLNCNPEGVPRVIDEAIALGVPVVASRVGGVPMEYSRGEIILVEPSSPAELAGAINSFWSDSAVREQLAGRAKARAAAMARRGNPADQHLRMLLGGRSLDL